MSNVHHQSKNISDTRLHYVWRAMRQRCQNPNAQQYKHYGGRGIKVCPEWEDSRTFIEWALPRWRPGLSLDRIDNDGDYTPDNCRFAGRVTQGLNRRKGKNNTSGHSGVSYIKAKEKWKAYGTVEGTVMYLGIFEKKEDAIEARKAWERRHVRHRLNEHLIQ